MGKKVLSIQYNIVSSKTTHTHTKSSHHTPARMANIKRPTTPTCHIRTLFGSMHLNKTNKQKKKNNSIPSYNPKKSGAQYYQKTHKEFQNSMVRYR